MKLAINGGQKVRSTLFPDQNTIGEQEIEAANRVLHDGLLTGYQANHDRMYGGPEIQALCKEWSQAWGEENFILKHAKDGVGRELQCIPVNSCTSGLVVACGAIDIRPGDEVIVTPYSMTCSATAPMVWGGVPVFADVDPLTFNLDPDDVERKITPRTKAIIVVDLFGCPYDRRIDEIAAKHGLKVIEDAAQAVGAMRDGRYAGTLGHIGVFSFNLGKHLTCGEGGMICTYDEDLAIRCRLLMNHAESVINSMSTEQLMDSILIGAEGSSVQGMFGFNLRMTELSAAILRAQLSRRDELIGKRVQNAAKLVHMMINIPGIVYTFYNLRDSHSHTYYVCPFLFDEAAWGVHRDKVVTAVKAELMPCAGREYEGVTIGAGYIKPIHMMPVFANYEKKVRGPWENRYQLEKPSTPVCEDLWKNKLIVTHRFFGPNALPEDLEQIVAAFKKVWDNREELK